MANYEIDGDELVVGGEPISRIMGRIGDRPAYLYDRNLIRRRVESLRETLPESVSLHYAIKANPMPEVVELLAGLVDGLDIASAGELDVAISTGTATHDISFAGPGKSDGDLTAAIDAGVTINVESFGELRRICGFVDSQRPKVALRINPDFEVKSSGMKMAGGAKPFGIDAELAPGVLAEIKNCPVDFQGIHIFSGAQNLNHEPICESQQYAIRLALDLCRGAGLAPRFVNIGGGFGIPYFRGDQPLNLEPIAANLDHVAEQLSAEYPDCELVLELGRYFVGEAGVYVCRVIDRKVSRGQVFLVTNGGLHHHLAASGNFGQILRKNYPVAIATRMGSDDTETASVVGPLCTPLDLLADKAQLAIADVGDYVAVFQSGAYGYTASPHLFLSHPLPAELLL